MAKIVHRTSSRLAGAIAILLLAMALPAVAQSPLLKDGFAALKAGKNIVAVKRLTDALGTGKLTPAETAKAYYGRGLAYEAMRKPAQAIADLTSAIWLGGLTPEERESAEAKRAKAYAAAGVSQPARAARQRTAALATTAVAPATSVAPAKSSEVSATPALAAQTSGWSSSVNGGGIRTATAVQRQSAAPTPGPSETSGSGGLTSLWQSSGLSDLFGSGDSAGGSSVTAASPSGGASSIAQTLASGVAVARFTDRDQSSFAPPPAREVPAKTRVARPMVLSPGPTKLASAGQGTSEPAGRASAALAWNTNVSGGTSTTVKAKAARPQPEGSSGFGQSVSSMTSFFGGLFGSSSATAPTKPQVVLAKSKSALLAQSSQRGHGASGQATTKVAAAQPARDTKTIAGKFNLQVAAVRSLDEARSIAGDLTQKHADLLASYQTRIDETVHRSMGRFYRVRLGPFLSVKDSLSLCSELRRAGVGCFLLLEGGFTSSPESSDTRLLSDRILRRRM